MVYNVRISSFEISHKGGIDGGQREEMGKIGTNKMIRGRVRGDASYDILPPEVPGSASGSVPAGYCPVAH